MNAAHWQNAGLVTLLLIAGAISWGFQLREPMAVDTRPLGELPSQVLAWEGRDVEMEGTVEEILRADQHVQREYFDEAGVRVWMYLGYYGTLRGGRSEHSPWVCYPAAGWDVLDSHTRKLAIGSGRKILGRALDRQLAAHWPVEATSSDATRRDG